MRCLLALPAACAILSIASVASAHETLPANWCANPDKTPLVIDNFALDGDQLQELVDKCGIVDFIARPDAWTLATLAIGDYCRSMASAQDEPVPFISGPKFYRLPTHHDDYSLDHGLSGVCAVCVTR